MRHAALSIDALDAAVTALPDNGLSTARRAALEQLRQNGLPGVRDEDWKYTDLTPVISIANTWLEQGAATAEPVVSEPPPTVDADWIRITNGQIDFASLDGLPAGVSVQPLSDSGAPPRPQGRLGDLNMALLIDGLKITVHEGTRLARPVGIHIADDARTTGVSQVRIDIVAEAGSNASFVENQVSGGEADLYSNSVISLAIAPSAIVDYVRIQCRDRRHNQTSHLAVELDRDAQFRHASFDLGGRLVRNDLAVSIASPGAQAVFDGLYLVGDGQHIDNHTRVDHRVGPAVSRQEYRGILNGKSRGIWNGKAIVHDGADGTDAEQANHNLLLSKNAEIDAKPELEIYADDVKCSHGTTVGQLDETALFYLRTRGLDRRAARQMLTHAFAEAIIDRSPVEQLHDYLAAAVGAELRQLMPEDDR
jgi:Fe-S cluster assembly protein SufD